jgi:hypothetical protein
MINENTFLDITSYHSETTNTDVLEVDLEQEHIDMIYDQVVDKYNFGEGFSLATALSIFLTETVEKFINESKTSKAS